MTANRHTMTKLKDGKKKLWQNKRYTQTLNRNNHRMTRNRHIQQKIRPTVKEKLTKAERQWKTVTKNRHNKHEKNDNENEKQTVTKTDTLKRNKHRMAKKTLTKTERQKENRLTKKDTQWQKQTH